MRNIAAGNNTGPQQQRSSAVAQATSGNGFQGSRRISIRGGPGKSQQAFAGGSMSGSDASNVIMTHTKFTPEQIEYYKVCLTTE
jgi:predicted CDP-diglyceride synthetase/phosphatidate cytidylyltransferase